MDRNVQETQRCRLCASLELEPLLDLGAMPIAHRLLDGPDAAEELFGFALWVCRTCSLVQIVHPIDPELLYRQFNYNFSSWKNEPHLAAEITRILDTVSPQSVLEIGCNDGRFLAELQAACGARGIGIEPNAVSGEIARGRGFAVYPEMISAALFERIRSDHGHVDAVISRQVFEHVIEIDTFLAGARTMLREDGFLFIDVPDFEPALGLGDVSVLWEEHVNYFTEPILLAAFARHGFTVRSIDRYDFSGGTIAVLAQRSTRVEPDAVPSDLDALVGRARAFPQLVADYGNRLRAELRRAREHGVTVALYGVGVRGCTGANGLRLHDCFDVVLDDQPQRVGKYMPGLHVRIDAPNSLAHRSEPILCVLAVNNENEASVRERFDVVAGPRVTYVSMCGPRDIWNDLRGLELRSWNDPRAQASAVRENA